MIKVDLDEKEIAEAIRKYVSGISGGHEATDVRFSIKLGENWASPGLRATVDVEELE